MQIFYTAENHLDTTELESVDSDPDVSSLHCDSSSTSDHVETIQDVIEHIATQEAMDSLEETQEEWQCRTTGAPNVSIGDVEDELMFRIKRAGDLLVSNAAALIDNLTSNLAESFMSLRTKMDGGKMFNRVQSGSFQHRCVATGLRVQMGPTWGASTWEKVTGLQAGSVLRQSASVAERQHNSDVQRKRSQAYKESRVSAKFRKSSDGSRDAMKSYGENAQQPDISIDELRHLCNEYKDSLQLTREEVSKIEAQTREQAQSAYWYEVRHRRITASNVGKIARRRPTTKVTNLVRSLLYDSHKSRSPALQWGRDNEPVARRTYCQFQNSNRHVNLSTQPSGFVVCLEESWLGCSPDDFVTDPSSAPNVRGLAEYKCPYILREKSIERSSVLNKRHSSAYDDKKMVV